MAARTRSTTGRGAVIVTSAIVLAWGLSSVALSAAKPLTKKQAMKLFALKGDVYTKGEVYSKSEVYQKSDVYQKSEVYSQSEADAEFLGEDDTAANSQLLDGSNSAATSTGGAVYVSQMDGDLPTNTVDAAAIDDGFRQIPIPVHSLDEAFNPGADPAKTFTGLAPTLAFDDTTDESILFSLPLPNDLVASGGLDVILHWSADTPTGTVVWTAEFLTPATGELVGGMPSSVAETIESPSGTAGGLAGAAILSTGVTAGDQLLVARISRDADHSGMMDSMSGDAKLHAITVRYTASS